MRSRILNSDVLASHGNIAGRKTVLDILEAGLRAADPYENTRKLIRIDDGKLIIGDPDFEPAGDPRSGQEVFDLSRLDRILVVGAAKGVQLVAKAIEDVLGDRLTAGHVIAKHGDPLVLERIGVTFGGHPVPDGGCVEGCQRIREMCRGLRENDLVFTIAGNGISSLLTLPAPGITLDDLRRTTYLMQIERGAPTPDLNPIRSHLDMMKGGRISRHLQPAMAIHILAYDANGNIFWREQGYRAFLRQNQFLHTVCDSMTFTDAIRMLRKWDAWEAVPASVRHHLERADPAHETVKIEEFERMRFRIFGVLPRKLGMVPTAARRARELSLTPHTLATWLQAEASQAGGVLADIARSIERDGVPFEPPCVLFTAGELLVTVGQEQGVGGRNQECALAAALRIAGSPNIVMGMVDSDGTDGPGTQFLRGGADIPCLAGGLTDGETVAEAIAAQVDIHDALKRHDTTLPLWRLKSGIVASPGISLTDLGVILISGRANRPSSGAGEGAK